MAEIVVDGADLVVRLRRREKAAALRGDVRVPVSSVRSAVVDERPFAQVRGIRAPGGARPGRFAIGTWRRRRGRDFVAIRRGQRAVIVDLDRKAAGFARLIVGSDDPEAVVRRLRRSAPPSIGDR